MAKADRQSLLGGNVPQRYLCSTLVLPFVFLLCMTSWTAPLRTLSNPASSATPDVFVLDTGFNTSSVQTTRIYHRTVSAVAVQRSRRKQNAHRRKRALTWANHRGKRTRPHPRLCDKRIEGRRNVRVPAYSTLTSHLTCGMIQIHTLVSSVQYTSAAGSPSEGQARPPAARYPILRWHSRFISVFHPAGRHHAV
ncbi:hypothetical protein DFH08DRAFT_146520 [Mycena albidolilacea]|uniref:Uncharacterized protein n=1 Tax=Mycena albidolilacea TaxID=1033008 RepID=A0AAD6YX85_9AGAR|nr:hypothetical protein DFH08DRAFT_146520 [Mycena albidolilacea]